MLTIKDWPILVKTGQKIFALETASVDLPYIFRFFGSVSLNWSMPIYYWNLGYRQFQQVSSEGGKYRLLTTDKRVDNNSILNWFDNNDCPGIFILDDLVNFLELSFPQKCQRESQIQNLFWRVNSTNQYLIFLGNYLQFSEKLRANVPVLKYPLPSSSEIEAIVKAFFEEGRGQRAEGRRDVLRRQNDNCTGIQTHQQLKNAKTPFVGGLKPTSEKEEVNLNPLPSASCLLPSRAKPDNYIYFKLQTYLLQMSFREQFIWQKAIDLSVRCYKLTDYFPKSEIYGITSQIRRASVSIPSNISEGYGRKGKGEYVNFLHIALGSARELETQLVISLRLEFAKKHYIESVLKDVDEMQRLLVSSINKLKE